MKWILFSFIFLSLEVNAASRIITLSPALTELIYALNFEGKLVGVSEFSDYPIEAKSIISVGPYTKPSIEKIISLNPDLVLIPIEGPDDVRLHFDQIKIPYKTVSMNNLNEIGDAAVEISTWLGNKKAGTDFKKNWDRKLVEIFSKKQKVTLKIFVEIQNQPLIAAGTHTFLDEIVTRCGAENIVSQKGYPKLSPEYLALKKPDVIFLADHFAHESEKLNTINYWKNFAPTQKITIIPLDPDLVARPGPRLSKGAEVMCRDIGEQSR